MKMTTRGRYGLRAMLELARCHGQGPVGMAALARRERLSRKYLHALLAALHAAGLVRSIRGAHGGFQLSRGPEDIRLSEILHAVEGPLSLVDCVRRPKACDRSASCTARRVWLGLSEAIEGLLSDVTLSKLLALEAEDLPKGKPRRSPAKPKASRDETSVGLPCGIAKAHKKRERGK